FENFVWWHGRVSRQFAKALAERARAGVKVHLLQDAMGCDDVRGPDFQIMREAGIELEMYRFVHLTRLNQRTHRKILVIDGKLGFTGGVGIGDRWDGHGDNPDSWRDSHFCLEGPAVAQMQQAFLDNWMQTRGCVLHGDDYFPELKPVGDDVCQVFKSSADEGSDSARIMLLLSIAAARKSVQIANAYFIPDDLTIETLLDARRRGVDVEIITPGRYIDQSWVRWVSRARWRPLLKAGIRMHEFQLSNFHCKYMIVDDCWCSVGSANLDNRSMRLNEETNLNVLDREFASNLRRTFEADKKNSCEVTIENWRHRPALERIRARVGLLARAQM
ncbi:MAG: cardiolipin synthase B, partial [Verrucomicrobiaceae bacterium]